MKSLRDKPCEGISLTALQSCYVNKTSRVFCLFFLSLGCQRHAQKLREEKTHVHTEGRVRIMSVCERDYWNY